MDFPRNLCSVQTPLTQEVEAAKKLCGTPLAPTLAWETHTHFWEGCPIRVLPSSHVGGSPTRFLVFPPVANPKHILP